VESAAIEEPTHEEIKPKIEDKEVDLA